MFLKYTITFIGSFNFASFIYIIYLHLNKHLSIKKRYIFYLIDFKSQYRQVLPKHLFLIPVFTI
jgi:hypothetical protein